MFEKWYNLSMPSIVALDLETTGLDSRADTIIEIGAIRFNERRIEEEFSTFNQPPAANLQVHHQVNRDL